MISSWIGKIKNQKQFFKYCIGGGTAFVVDFSLLWFFTEVIGFWYLFSATTSFVISVIVNYLIQRYWTFGVVGNKNKQFTLFLAAQIIGLFINNTTLYILVEDVHFHYLLAKAVAAGIVLVWNFWASKEIIFNPNSYKKKPEIIIAGEIFPPDIGGPATYGYRLVKYLLGKGYDVHIICYSAVMPLKSQEEFKGGITRINSYLPVPLKYLVYFFKLLNLSPKVKTIYAQGPVASGWPAYLVSKILRKRLVIKIVGDYAWEQARLYGATSQSIDYWQVGPNIETKKLSLQIKVRFLSYIEKVCARSADKVIVPSHYLKKVVTSWNVSPHNVQVIYNSADFPLKENLTREQAKERLEIEGDFIITVSRLVPWKGFDTLIDIMPELKKVNPKFKLVIVGSGPEEGKLRRKINRMKLKDEVILAGRQNQKRVAYYYQASSIFVLNSSYEGLSHVILEAMYFNLPIVVSDIAGNRELIENDYNGLVVRYNDKGEWIKAITKLWKNKELIHHFESNSLDKMHVFSFSNMMKETLKVLDEKH